MILVNVERLCYESMKGQFLLYFQRNNCGCNLTCNDNLYYVQILSELTQEIAWNVACLLCCMFPFLYSLPVENDMSTRMLDFVCIKILSFV